MRGGGETQMKLKSNSNTTKNKAEYIKGYVGIHEGNINTKQTKYHLEYALILKKRTTKEMKAFKVSFPLCFFQIWTLTVTCHIQSVILFKK